MKYQTSRFGTIDIPETDILIFPEGLLGFAGMKRFCLIDMESQRPFSWLQSLDSPTLAFICTDPLIFFPDYKVPVKAIELADIKLDSPEDATILVIIVIPPEPAKITANLQGPLVINNKSHLAKQLVIIDTPYHTRHRIFSEEVTDAGA